MSVRHKRQCCRKWNTKPREIVVVTDARFGDLIVMDRKTVPLCFEHWLRAKNPEQGVTIIDSKKTWRSA